VSALVGFLGLHAALADTPAAASAAGTDEPQTMPQDGFFSSITQNLREGNQEIVRGHFDLGEPPNVHRYYCLVDPKSGRREPNGVLGDPIKRPDGMTSVNGHDVSMYTCAKAEQKGYLVTQGYVVPANVARTASASSAAAPAAAAATAPAAASPAATAVPPAAGVATATPPPPLPPRVSADRIDVAGVKLGMSPDEVRAALKSKRLHDFKEWPETLSYSDKGTSHPVASFVNVMAAWTAPASSGDDTFDTEGEVFEVMFTPVPGHERAMAIIHSEGFTPASAVHESVLDAGLLKKYGGYVTPGELPDAVTWRFQRDGSVQVGDACGRRGTYGGLGGLAVSNTPRQNLALKRTPDELRAQIDRCGIAVVTEDHYTLNGGALAADRLVTRFTVTAFSPALALDGATTAAQLIQAAGHSTPASTPARDARAPDL
jgi:hypothetical protein